MRPMRVQWATNEKAMMASNKHFNGAFNTTQMTTVATAMIKRADMVGVVIDLMGTMHQLRSYGLHSMALSML